MLQIARRTRIAALVLVAACAPGLWAQLPAEQMPLPSIETALGRMPGVEALPARPALPDVLLMNDGERVTTPAQWTRRREEMKRILSYYAVGLMPPPPGRVRGRDLASRPVLGGEAAYRLAHISFGRGRRLGWDVAIFTPAHRSGPFPTIIFPAGPTPGAVSLPTLPRPPEQGKGVNALAVPLGDQAPRIAAAAGNASPVPTPPSPPEPEQVARAHAELLRRGYALVTYNYQDTGEDTIGRNADGAWAFRGTRFLPDYPGHDWGLLGAWAWGLSRVVDYLETQPFADRKRLIATGHSRLGKAVLVAGAYDERLALVAPAGSGAGGTGAYRFNGAAHGGREGLADMMRKYPNWFSPQLHQFRDQVEKLPFDQHWLIALTAPRAFLSLEGTADQNCEVDAVRQAFAGAAPAFALHAASSRLGVHYASHRHAFAPEDWEALLDFADSQLRGRPVARRFDIFPEDQRPLVR